MYHLSKQLETFEFVLSHRQVSDDLLLLFCIICTTFGVLSRSGASDFDNDVFFLFFAFRGFSSFDVLDILSVFV